MSSIDISLLARSTLLAGVDLGRATLSALNEQIIENPIEPEILFIDFCGAEVATASFLRECVFEFRELVRKRWSNYYPVIANANSSIQDEFRVLLQTHGGPFVFCHVTDESICTDLTIVGEFDEKQKVTFDLVSSLGETDARELMKNRSNVEDIGQTAWNNRLTTLARNGLIVELTAGRSKRYRPLPLEVIDGS